MRLVAVDHLHDGAVRAVQDEEPEVVAGRDVVTAVAVEVGDDRRRDRTAALAGRELVQLRRPHHRAVAVERAHVAVAARRHDLGHTVAGTARKESL